MENVSVFQSTGRLTSTLPNSRPPLPSVSSSGSHWADLVALLDADHPRQLFVAECQRVCGSHGNLPTLASVEVAAFPILRTRALSVTPVATGGVDLMTMMIRAWQTRAEAVQLPTVLLLLSLWVIL